MNSLRFNILRGANQERVGRFKNKHGNLAHAMPDGSDWSPAQWLQAMVGEVGEFANIRKKFERGDLTMAEYHEMATKELADIQIYLDLLAMRALDFDSKDENGDMVRHAHSTGIDLGQAVVDKFNEVSDRVGADVHIMSLPAKYIVRERERESIVVLGKGDEIEIIQQQAAAPEGEAA